MSEGFLQLKPQKKTLYSVSSLVSGVSKRLESTVKGIFLSCELILFLFEFLAFFLWNMTC